MASRAAFAIRREVIEYGALPIASWLGDIDSTAAVLSLLKQLTEALRKSGSDPNFIEVAELAQYLHTPRQHAQVLVDVLDSVAEERQLLVQRSADGAQADPVPQATAVDVHAAALFLVAQLYIRQCQRPEAMDVWPDRAQPGEAASSPGSSRSHTSSAHQVHFHPQKSTNLVRMELQAHIQQHHHMLSGYTDYLTRRAHVLLSLVRTDPTAELPTVTAAEFDRLALLLRPALPGSPLSSDGAAPMDIHSPINSTTDDVWRLSPSVPLFSRAEHPGHAPVTALATWLTDNIIDELLPAETLAGGNAAASSSHVNPVSSPHVNPAGSPLRMGSDRMGVERMGIDLPPAGIAQGNVVDIQGVVKSTIVRGEEDFPNGVLRVTDCHDMVAYALAPLQYASILGCSNCTVIVGAVGRMLRIEGCTRVTVIAAGVRVTISSCHECTFHLGVNRPPLLIGLNRFVQLAPYNTTYERLAGHMAAAGVAASPNLWDTPVTLAAHHAHGHGHAHTAADSAESSVALATEHPPVQLLPPERLLPFMTPFVGGQGPLCGGPAAFASALSRQSSTGSPPMQMSPDLGNLIGLDDSSSSMTQAPPGPFRLPPAYEEAKEHKVAAVADLRSAVKQAVLDDARKRELQAVIQAHFKEWLTQSGNMRQVYDLARMEREEASGHVS